MSILGVVEGAAGGWERKLLVYLAGTAVLLGIGGFGGYKLGRTLEHQANELEISKLSTKVNTNTTNNVVVADAGQKAATASIAATADAQQKSVEARDAILRAPPKAQPVLKTGNADLKLPTLVPTCNARADTLQLVNQLLEKSNETGFYVLPLATGWVLPVSPEARSESAERPSGRAEGLDPKVEAGELRTPPEV